MTTKVQHPEHFKRTISQVPNDSIPNVLMSYRAFVFCVGATLLAIVSCLLYLPVAIRFLQVGSDYTRHIQFAEGIYRTHHLLVPHFLFHLLIIGVVQLTAATFSKAALIVLGAFYAFTGLLVYRESAKALIPAESSKSILVGSALAALLLGIAILLMQPILKPGGPYTYQLGYFWAEPYLNPTYAVMKPLALASALYALLFLTTGEASRRAIAVAGIATAAGALAKPSFVMCLVPAVAVMAAMRARRNPPIDWKATCWGVLVPAIAILLFEYYLSFSRFNPQAEYQNAIVLAPFKVLRAHSGHIALKLLFSVAFPLGVYLLYWRRARQDFSLNFAFLLFAFGLGYSTLLAETDNWFYGNFLWSGYITLFILFVFSATFFVRQLKGASWKGTEAVRHSLASVLLLLHIHSGILAQLAALHDRLPVRGI